MPRNITLANLGNEGDSRTVASQVVRLEKLLQSPSINGWSSTSTRRSACSTSSS